MNFRSSSLLQLPSGSAAMFLQEARKHQQLVRQLNTLYDSWGYLPVHTPLADYSRAYEDLVSEADLRRVYHLVDRDGEILMLRWDITLFLIKHIGSLLSESPLPLRLCYSDTILRHQEAEDISRNEFFQTGVELIGSPAPEGDLEVLLVLWHALSGIGLDPQIHLGSRTLFNAISAGISPQTSAELAAAISFRDSEQIEQSLVECGKFPDAPTRAALRKLFLLIGNPEEARAALKDITPVLAAAHAAEAKRVVDFATYANKLEPGMALHVDFSELGSQGYHSGAVFRAYVDGLDTAVAAGGRYDKLLSRQGTPLSATGFSIMLSKVEHLAHPKIESEPEITHMSALIDSAILSNAPRGLGEEFATRYRNAEELRVSGKRVAL